jgi:hypothetical protein
MVDQSARTIPRFTLLTSYYTLPSVFVQIEDGSIVVAEETKNTSEKNACDPNCVWRKAVGGEVRHIQGKRLNQETQLGQFACTLSIAKPGLEGVAVRLQAYNCPQRRAGENWRPDPSCETGAREAIALNDLTLDDFLPDDRPIMAAYFPVGSKEYEYFLDLRAQSQDIDKNPDQDREL